MNGHSFPFPVFEIFLSSGPICFSFTLRSRKKMRSNSNMPFFTCFDCGCSNRFVIPSTGCPLCPTCRVSNKIPSSCPSNLVSPAMKGDDVKRQGNRSTRSTGIPSQKSSLVPGAELLPSEGRLTNQQSWNTSEWHKLWMPARAEETKDL